MEKKRILIVDDELDTRAFLSTLLETNGYEPVIAADGSQGIEKLKKGKPALVILDVMMPKEEGLRIYRELKADDEFKEIPVIMLSRIEKKIFFHPHLGRSVPEPEAYIKKPFESEELLKSARDLLYPRR